MENKIYIIGMGPGREDMMTNEAIYALEMADVIIGYTTYVRLLGERFADKEIRSTPMKQEVERCRMAFEKAEEGKTTAYEDELSETVTLPTSEYCGFRPAGESEIPIETLAPSSPSRVNLIATAELISNESGISASAFISAFALSSAFTVIRSSDISPPVIPIAEKRFAYTACGVSPHMREEIAIEVTNAF